jgi:hypothetical protein
MSVVAEPLSEVRGYHRGDYEDYRSLGLTQCGKSLPKFRRDAFSPGNGGSALETLVMYQLTHRNITENNIFEHF